MFWKYRQKYILIHWTKLVRLQFDAWLHAYYFYAQIHMRF